MNEHDEDRPAPFASPSCFMREIDPDQQTDRDACDPRQRTDVKRRRKAERKRPIDSRRASTGGPRRDHNAGIGRDLAGATGSIEVPSVGACWPVTGEPNLRPFLKDVAAQGGRCALPVVVARGGSLVFRARSPGGKLERGVWNIPAPRKTARNVVPDVAIAPAIGLARAVTGSAMAAAVEMREGVE